MDVLNIVKKLKNNDYSILKSSTKFKGFVKEVESFLKKGDVTTEDLGGLIDFEYENSDNLFNYAIAFPTEVLNDLVPEYEELIDENEEDYICMQIGTYIIGTATMNVLRNDKAQEDLGVKLVENGVCEDAEEASTTVSQIIDVQSKWTL